MGNNFEMLFSFIEDLYRIVSDKAGMDYFDRMDMEEKLKELKKITVTK